jgi:hypothetical protein
MAACRSQSIAYALRLPHDSRKEKMMGGRERCAIPNLQHARSSPPLGPSHRIPLSSPKGKKLAARELWETARSSNS